MSLMAAVRRLLIGFGKSDTAPGGKPVNLEKVKIDKQTYKKIPIVTENALGRAMEPLSILLLGPFGQWVGLLESAGWHKADPVSFRSLQKAMWALFRHGPYTKGPVTPVYIGRQVQDEAMQKPTGTNQFRQRHHLRMWKTNLKSSDNQPITVMHASFDVGIKALGVFSYPPIHRISPHIDAERDLIRDELVYQGAHLLGAIQLSTPFESKNGYGDVYFTDGRAYVLEIRN